jgi:hypothetical protein
MISRTETNHSPRSVARYFTEDSRPLTNSASGRGSNPGRVELEVNAMTYTSVKARVPYARALYAAAVAALLSACAQVNSPPAASAASAPTREVSETRDIPVVTVSDMPVVIVTASREEPGNTG